MDAGSLRVVCTDRGTHPSRELADFTVMEDYALFEALQTSYADDPARALHEYERTQIRVSTKRGSRRAGDSTTCSRIDDVQGGEQRWRFRCPTCRRDVPMKAETLRRLVAGVLDATPTRRASVDLSVLPTNLGSSTN